MIDVDFRCLSAHILFVDEMESVMNALLVAGMGWVALAVVGWRFVEPVFSGAALAARAMGVH